MPNYGFGDYGSAYAGALAENQNRYQQILGLHQQQQAAHVASGRAIGTGYGQLQSDVLGGIQGIDASERQRIADQYNQQGAQASQTLINRGLGNTTVQQSVLGGIAADRSKADLALTNQTQGLNAQYRSQLGLAGLSYQERAAMQYAGLQGDQIRTMEGVQSAYPDAGLYAQLAALQGQNGQGSGFTMSGAGQGGGGPGFTTLGTRGAPLPGPTPGYGNVGSAPSAGGFSFGGAPPAGFIGPTPTGVGGGGGYDPFAFTGQPAYGVGPSYGGFGGQTFEAPSYGGSYTPQSGIGGGFGSYGGGGSAEADAINQSLAGIYGGADAVYGGYGTIGGDNFDWSNYF